MNKEESAVVGPTHVLNCIVENSTTTSLKGTNSPVCIYTHSLTSCAFIFTTKMHKAA